MDLQGCGRGLSYQHWGPLLRNLLGQRIDACRFWATNFPHHQILATGENPGCEQALPAIERPDGGNWVSKSLETFVHSNVFGFDGLKSRSVGS